MDLYGTYFLVVAARNENAIANIYVQRLQLMHCILYDCKLTRLRQQQEQEKWH